MTHKEIKRTVRKASQSVKHFRPDARERVEAHNLLADALNLHHAARQRLKWFNQGVELVDVPVISPDTLKRLLHE